jgi:poly(A) polymerase
MRPTSGRDDPDPANPESPAVRLMGRIREIVAKSEFAGVSYAFGGYVRDVVIGGQPRDVDILVMAPDGGARLARLISTTLAGTEVVTYGRAAVAQCVIDDVSVECRNAYRSAESPGCSQGDALISEADAMDFTVNAIFQDIVSGEVMDPSGAALADIRGCVIRTPRRPAETLSADPKRLIRAVRLAAELEFALDPEVAAYILAHATDVLHGGIERVRDELLKLLDSPDSVRGVRLMDETGLLAVLLPEVAALKGVDQGSAHHTGDAFEHTLAVLGAVCAEPELRLAALLHDIGKPATRSVSETGVHFYGHEGVGAVMAARRLRAMRLPLRTRRRACRLVRNHMYLTASVTVRQLRRLRARLDDDESLLKLAELRHADRLAHRDPGGVALVREFLTAAGPLPVRRSPLTGRDVMTAFGLESGPEVGRLLHLAAGLYAEDPHLSRGEILDALGLRQRPTAREEGDE